MDLIFVLLITAGALVLGGVGGYLVFRYVRWSIQQKSRLRSSKKRNCLK